MSGALTYTYSDPYKLPAGLLALAAHALLFALLYFGVKWQVQPPQGMEVELWSDLPELNIATPKSEPQQQAESAKPRELEKPVAAKADIELAKKKKQPPKAEAKPKPPMTKAERKKAQADMKDLIWIDGAR